MKGRGCLGPIFGTFWMKKFWEKIDEVWLKRYYNTVRFRIVKVI